MNKKSHKLLIWMVAITAIIWMGVFLVSRTSLGESVKRESAKLFDYEYIPNQHVIIDSCGAAKGMDSIYTDFRQKFRFHYQGIGMASFADSSRMILLSDLPPHFETDSVPYIFSEFTHRTELRKHPIGYDGYTTDMVILLGNATQENCDRLIRQLNRELFFSEYKPTVMPLPAEHGRQYFARENTGETNLDYQITLEEFNTWFMVDGEGFVNLDDTATVQTVSGLFASQARGVYFSQQPGFVAWAVAKNADIAPQVGDIRQFTLDADLILGALADSNTLVIIGRERQSPLYELPPLQIESILLLASTTEKELSQSLDINDLMAGKMNNGRDWCPTYLSRELENTEFGDLMTLTDVLLKDWSERGTIQESHYRYPEPGYYPFDRPLFRKLGLSELVYNWNTAGAMYAIDNVEFRNTNIEKTDSHSNAEKTDESNSKFNIQNSTFTIYTLGRTGSLPVSYFNSQERSHSIGYRYESQAYHYFATLGCTDLARVVQYTALYQLFIDNNISYSGNTYPSFPKNKPFLLYKPTRELLDTLRHLSGEQMGVLADSLALRSFRSYQKEQVDKQLNENEQQYHVAYTDEHIDAIYRQVHHNTVAGISRGLQEVKQMLGNLSEEQYKQLARYLSYPRGVTLRDREGYNLYLRARRVNQLVREMGKNNLDLLGKDLAKVKNYFAANLSASAGRYLKTPSLIVTYNDMLTTGGHNLSSRISRVNSMSHYKRSRGGYTPTDYEQPAASKPEPTSPVPSSTTPANARPTQKSAGKQTGASPRKPSTSQSGNKKPTASSHHGTTRSRSSVIPNTPRKTRGL